jgi:hypothetical protein
MKRISAVEREWGQVIGGLLLAALFANVAWSAVLYTEMFDAGANGWVSRDGAMVAGHTVGTGNSPGSMQGQFASQGFPIPQTDAFRINEADDPLGHFTGNYVGTGLTGFTFDLLATDVLPSDLALRIVSGANTLFYAVNLGGMALNTWTTFTVSLLYSSGWQSDEAAFNLALFDVDQVEVQLTRSGGGEQYFFLDNFGTTDEDLGGGGEEAVPEPSTGVLFLCFGATVYGLRKRTQSTPAGEVDS